MKGSAPEISLRQNGKLLFVVPKRVFLGFFFFLDQTVNYLLVQDFELWLLFGYQSGHRHMLSDDYVMGRRAFIRLFRDLNLTGSCSDSASVEPKRFWRRRCWGWWTGEGSDDCVNIVVDGIISDVQKRRLSDEIGFPFLAIQVWRGLYRTEKACKYVVWKSRCR